MGDVSGAVDGGNAEIVRRLMMEVWGKGRFALLPELVAPEYVAHLAIGDHYGPEGVRIEVAVYRGTMPDLTVTVEGLTVQGDTVVRRFTLRGTCGGRMGPGRAVRFTGIGVDRVVDGMLIESWVVIAGAE